MALPANGAPNSATPVGSSPFLGHDAVQCQADPGERSGIGGRIGPERRGRQPKTRHAGPSPKSKDPAKMHHKDDIWYVAL